jgi:hypothetical protein
MNANRFRFNYHLCKSLEMLSRATSADAQEAAVERNGQVVITEAKRFRGRGIGLCLDNHDAISTPDKVAAISGVIRASNVEARENFYELDECAPVKLRA